MSEKTRSIDSVIAKRRCLYTFLIFIMLLIVANIGITALLLYYINLSKHSIGEIRLDAYRTLINGELLLENGLVTEQISTRNKTLYLLGGGAIQMESHQNDLLAAFKLDSQTLLQAEKFSIRNSQGQDVLLLSSELAKAHFRRVQLSGKAQALQSLQTGAVYSMPSTTMRIASNTRKLDMFSANSLSLVSTGGNVSVSSLNEIQVTARQILLGAKAVYLKNLPGLQTTTSSSSTSVYELCICSDGKLVPAPEGRGCNAILNLCT